MTSDRMEEGMEARMQRTSGNVAIIGTQSSTRLGRRRNGGTTMAGNPSSGNQNPNPNPNPNPNDGTEEGVGTHNRWKIE